MELKDKLMQDSLNCTFIACPCSDNANMPNVDTIFNMRKKVIELRDLVALQDTEIEYLRSSIEYISIKDLMIEIEALRGLLDEKDGGQIDDEGNFEKQLEEQQAEYRSELERIQALNKAKEGEDDDFKKQIMELREQL